MEIITQEYTKHITTKKHMIRTIKDKYIYKIKQYENNKLLDEQQYISGNFTAFKRGYLYKLQHSPLVKYWEYRIYEPFDYAVNNGLTSMEILSLSYSSIVEDIYGNKYSQLQFDGYYSEDKVDIDRMYNIIKDIATFTDNKSFIEVDGKRFINSFWYLPTVEQLENDYYRNRFLKECLK